MLRGGISLPEWLTVQGMLAGELLWSIPGMAALRRGVFGRKPEDELEVEGYDWLSRVIEGSLR